MKDKALLSLAGKTLIEVMQAFEEVLQENVKLKRALCELDTGGGDYFTSRRDIAELSGLGVMAASWDEHILVIKEKLNHPTSDKE